MRMAMWAVRTFDSIFSSSLHFHAAALLTLTSFFCMRCCRCLSQWLILWFFLFAHLVYSHCGRKQGEPTMRAPESPRGPHILSVLKASSPCEHSSEDQTQYSANICAPPHPHPTVLHDTETSCCCYIIMYFNIKRQNLVYILIVWLIFFFRDSK